MIFEWIYNSSKPLTSNIEVLGKINKICLKYLKAHFFEYHGAMIRPDLHTRGTETKAESAVRAGSGYHLQSQSQVEAMG